MSVCMFLWKPVDAIYQGIYLDNFSLPRDEKKIQEIEKELGAPDDVTKWTVWFDEMQKKSWSDGKIHETIDIYPFAGKHGQSHWRFYRRNQQDLLSKFNFQIHRTQRYTYKLLPVEQVAYYQGWMMKGRFMRSQSWKHYYTTWEAIERFLKKNVKNKYINTIVEEFKKYWEDGLIFECSF